MLKKTIPMLILCLILAAFTGCAGKELVQVHVSAIVPEENPRAAKELPPPITPSDPELLEIDPNGHPRNGLYKIYGRNGELLMERHYLDGYRHGPQNYYNDQTGTMMSHYFYDHGQLKTFIEYYPDGQPKLELDYIKDGQWRARTYDPNGLLREEIVDAGDS